MKDNFLVTAFVFIQSMIQNSEEQQILTFEKLEPTNIRYM